MRRSEAPFVVNGPDALIREAGTAVAQVAREMMGSCYARRVAVVAGPGSNGADGRVAAAWLKFRGARVDIVNVAGQPLELRGYDLVIDAAFGVGCSRPYVAPNVATGVKVLAVDVPSGVNADTGELCGAPLRADVTLAIGALKFCHLNGASTSYVGELRYVDLGVVGEFSDGVLEDRDLQSFVVVDESDHKWKHALHVLAGSPTMAGAAQLVCLGAMSAGASMVRLESHGELTSDVAVSPEVVRVDDSTKDSRSKAFVAGPGVGTDAATWLIERLKEVDRPAVLDADALSTSVVDLARGRHDWVLTPHEGEFARLTGSELGEDRIGAVRALSREMGCVVLLKGPNTLVASPAGTLRVVRSGTPALATAGSGDVLSGMIGGALSRGHDTLEAASMASHVHGRAGGRLGIYAGASSLPREVTAFLSERASSRPHQSRGHIVTV
jgi:NAD(P)H-hydrate epimerase